MQAKDLQSPVERLLPWALFCVGYLAANFVSVAVPMPLLWHLPVERRFTFEVRPLALGADFYGRVLLSLVAGALVAAAAGWAIRRRLLQARPVWLRGTLIWLIVVLLFTSGLYISVLRARQPIPAALPAGYVPR